MTIMLTPCQAAIEFDGINDYLKSKSISTSFGQKFSVSLWVKLNSVGSFSSILEPQWLSNGGPNYRPFTVYLCNTGKIASVFQDSFNSIDAHTSSTILNTVNWYHIVLVFDSTEILSSNRNKLYINSNLEIKTTSPGCVTTLQENITQNNNLMSSSQPLLAGVTKNLAGAESEFFNGKIDDIRIYSRTLSANEVLTLYNSRLKRPTGSLANGLIAHYEMDDDAIGEITAQAKDDSGNNNHGQFIGFDNLTSALTDDVPADIGTGNSIEFDGIDSYIEVSSPSSGPINDIGTGDFTLGIWASNKAITNYREMIGNWGTHGLFLGRDSSAGQLHAYVGDSNAHVADINYTIPSDNSWHFYILKRNSGICEVYVDGIHQGINFSAPGTLATSVTTRIGSRGDSVAEVWDGKIDNFHIFNRALSASEISFLYNGSGLDSGTSNLQALWTFDDDSAVKDSSGNNNHGFGVGGNSLKYTEGILKR